MQLRGIKYEDITQYYKTSMFLICPFCSFKCDKENGNQICQNSNVINYPIIDINDDKIIHRYLENKMTSAIVFGGLEPIDSFDEVIRFIDKLRNQYNCNDDICIYSGYNKDEIKEQIKELKKYKNIIIKYGRYIPNQKSIEDKVLGITLASDNQWAERIS